MVASPLDPPEDPERSKKRLDFSNSYHSAANFVAISRGIKRDSGGRPVIASVEEAIEFHDRTIAVLREALK